MRLWPDKIADAFSNAFYTPWMAYTLLRLKMTVEMLQTSPPLLWIRNAPHPSAPPPARGRACQSHSPGRSMPPLPLAAVRPSNAWDTSTPPLGRGRACQAMRGRAHWAHFLPGPISSLAFPQYFPHPPSYEPPTSPQHLISSLWGLQWASLMIYLMLPPWLPGPSSFFIDCFRLRDLFPQFIFQMVPCRAPYQFRCSPLTLLLLQLPLPPHSQTILPNQSEVPRPAVLPCNFGRRTELNGAKTNRHSGPCGQELSPTTDGWCKLHLVFSLVFNYTFPFAYFPLLFCCPAYYNPPIAFYFRDLILISVLWRLP